MHTTLPLTNLTISIASYQSIYIFTVPHIYCIIPEYIYIYSASYTASYQSIYIFTVPVLTFPSVSVHTIRPSDVALVSALGLSHRYTHTHTHTGLPVCESETTP